ncbi:Transcription activator AMTR1 like protein [Verticillium longisporum]|uniref:Transcription activator AMTR1 like protein n=1 Tax=Verticillium longisporum TaxID=100787 RepID=A0A8I2ZMW4_VERLO|nr:Transcription activator AMTR1 like protein [Verticillium longisporum]
MNLPSSHIPNRRSSSIGSLTPVRDLLCTPPQKAIAATAVPTKSRRSSRECKRGVRLNFIDVQVKKPPRLLPPTVEWSVQFQDESRQIASEYVGGLKRYAHLPKNPAAPARRHRGHLDPTLRRQAHQHRVHAASVADASLPPPPTHFQMPPAPALYGYPPVRNHPDDRDAALQHATDAPFPTPQNSGQVQQPYAFSLQDHFNAMREETAARHHNHRTSDTSSSATSIAPLATGPPPSFRGVAHNTLALDGMMTPPPSEKAVAGEREYLNSPEEIHYMQVFVEEVGIWMDSLDKDKHFSRLIPYHSLKCPMLLNAFLACGVKHLTLTHPDCKDDKALHYYDTATTQLLRSLQNPDRNTAECATTAVVLNVYEIMSEKPGQRMRMNHIAGARALIRECGWDARSTGIGAACFWLNIGMEVLSCLAFNWQTSWDPDQWGLNLDFADKPEMGASGGGDEEEWVHRIFYIVARIANFRASIPKFQEASPHDEQIRLGNRLALWQELKRLCDRWNNACPRTMHPFGYLYPTHSRSKSAFPNVWLIKRAAIIGRLFYHTAQCILAQTNPMEPARASEEMRVLQLHHAHQVCGIVAHTRDRGIASVAIRSLAIASAVLTDPREQEEVLCILERIQTESGWGLGSVVGELKRGWGWGDRSPLAMFYEQDPQQHQQQQQQPLLQQPQQTAAGPVAGHSGSKVNPLSFADFSLPNHPYQNWYEPPNRTNGFAPQGLL